MRPAPLNGRQDGAISRDGQPECHRSRMLMTEPVDPRCLATRAGVRVQRSGHRQPGDDVGADVRRHGSLRGHDTHHRSTANSGSGSRGCGVAGSPHHGGSTVVQSATFTADRKGPAGGRVELTMRTYATTDGFLPHHADPSSTPSHGPTPQHQARALRVHPGHKVHHKGSLRRAHASRGACLSRARC
jgi:hypothetical protein